MRQRHIEKNRKNESAISKIGNVNKIGTTKTLDKNRVMWYSYGSQAFEAESILNQNAGRSVKLLNPGSEAHMDGRN